MIVITMISRLSYADDDNKTTAWRKGNLHLPHNKELKVAILLKGQADTVEPQVLATC
jgi:hypothetical protein